MTSKAEGAVVHDSGVLSPAATRSAGRRAAAVIDLDALADNVRLLKEQTAAQLMAVVKADGYGHGAVPCARASVAAGADWLGVALPSEALELRAAGITAPILAWLWAPDEDIEPALRAGVTLVVSSLAHLDRVVGCGLDTVDIHLKLDTGLGRGGASRDDWVSLCRAARTAEKSGQVTVSGLMSHLASAELVDDPSVAQQTAAFEAGIGAAGQAGLTPRLRHLANSAATLLHPRTHFDLVRCGIAVYGLDPTETYAAPPVSLSPAASGLRPVMTLRSQVVLTKRVPAGHGVSYGLTYRTAAETTLALIPLGYADGIPRAASGRCAVSVGGTRYPVVGRIAMDQLVIDVGDAVVMAGDEALIFGSGGSGEPTAKDWAIAADTIDYEIVTRISARVDRVLRGGPVVPK